MADLGDLLTPDRVVLDVTAASKRQALKGLAQQSADVAHRPAADLLDALIEREKLGTTGIGDGMAIPHAKLEGLDRMVGAFMRLAQPVDFDSLDDQPVDLFFLLLAPADAATEHLKALSRVARIFRNADLCEQLRRETDHEKVFDLLTDHRSSHAA